LMVTDSVIFAPEDPPEIVQEDPKSLLFRAKDNARDPALDNAVTRKKGWGKTVLFSQFLQPEKVRASLIKDYPALLAWDEGWEESWNRVKNRLFVSPIVQVLVFSQAPKTVRSWVDEVCRWPFNKIIPAHFQAPIRASPTEFRKAFEVALQTAREGGEEANRLSSSSSSSSSPQPAVPVVTANENALLIPNFFVDLFGGLLVGSSGASGYYQVGLPAKEMAGDFKLLRNFEKTIRGIGVVKGPKE